MFGRNDNNQDDQTQAASTEPAATVNPTVPEPAGDATATPPPPTDDISLELPATPAPPQLTTPTPSPDTTAAATATPSSPPAVAEDLLTIKQEALQQLSPLIGHLDQTAEEKFRTTMMMIQATDDHTKIKDAYDAAQAITDDKARAQALLDIVNEINYFTQQHKPAEAAA